MVNELAIALEKTYETYTFSVETVNVMNDRLAALVEIPDSYWGTFDVDRAFTTPEGNDTAVVDIIFTLESSLANGIFSTYGLTTSSKSKAEANNQANLSDAEGVALMAVIERLRMIVSPLLKP